MHLMQQLKTAGDPKVIKLEQTVKKARELQQSLIGFFS